MMSVSGPLMSVTGVRISCATLVKKLILLLYSSFSVSYLSLRMAMSRFIFDRCVRYEKIKAMMSPDRTK